MKRLIYLFFLSSTLLLASCDDFLDRDPESTLSSDTYWETELDLSTWNAGTYVGLQATLRTSWFYWGELRSGVYWARGTAYDTNLLFNGLSSSHSSSSWSDLYKTIYRANAAIKHIPESSLSSTVSDPYLAQAYAMRALMYFYAIRLWGAVPMITEPTEDIGSQERYYGRTSVDDLKSFILENIDKAIEAFGATIDMSSSSKYYLNRGSAMALKLDVLMWYKEYDQALTVANDLISNYGYALQASSSYKSMFLDPTSSNEMIFNLYWDVEEYGSGFGYAQEIASGSNTIRYHPSEAIFKELVNRKKEDIRVTFVMDTLWTSNFITPDVITEESYTKAYNGDYGNAANFQVKCPKFVEYSATANSGTGGYSYDANGVCATRMPIYRMADIMLLKAEALVLGTNKNYQGAINIVNQIRTRAGWTNTAILADYPTENDLIKLIIDERTIELWAEGKRWFDLVRNDMVDEYLDPYMIDRGYTEGFEVGATKPSANHIGGYGKILWPLNQDVFRKNPAMSGLQNPPYEE